jgi:hypothetical protein
MGKTANRLFGCQVAQASSRPGLVISGRPLTIQVNQLVETARIHSDSFSYIAVILLVTCQPGTDDHCLVNSTGIHLVKKLIHPAARFTVWHRLRVRPSFPGMAMAIHDHAV